jgi:plastocyanin
MRRSLAFASTMILGTASVLFFGCSSSTSPPATGNTSSSSSGGSGSGSSSSGGGGGTTKYKFDFAATANNLNGGKGQVINAHVGDTIVWTNDDVGVAHSIVPCTTDCNSTSMNGAALFTTTGTGMLVTGTAAGVDFPPVTFTAAGTYLYECGVHTTMMIGQVIVQ